MEFINIVTDISHSKKIILSDMKIENVHVDKITSDNHLEEIVFETNLDGITSWNKNPNIKKLSFIESNLTFEDIKFILQKYENIDRLDLSKNTMVITSGDLFKNIVVLTLTHCELENLDFLEGNKTITDLNVSCNMLKNTNSLDNIFVKKINLASNICLAYPCIGRATSLTINKCKSLSKKFFKNLSENTHIRYLKMDHPINFSVNSQVIILTLTAEILQPFVFPPRLQQLNMCVGKDNIIPVDTNLIHLGLIARNVCLQDIINNPNLTSINVRSDDLPNFSKSKSLKYVNLEGNNLKSLQGQKTLFESRSIIYYNIRLRKFDPMRVPLQRTVGKNGDMFINSLITNEKLMVNILNRRIYDVIKKRVLNMFFE